MTTNCFFNFDLLDGGNFQYQYQSHGKMVFVNVHVDGYDLRVKKGYIDDVPMVNEQSFSITDDDLSGCEDIDDCTLVIGRYVIKDNDGEVETRFLDNNWRYPTGVEYVKRLNKDLEFITNTDDESWYLTLRGDVSRDITQFNFCEVEEDGIKDVISMFEEEDTDSIFDYVLSSDTLETVENFQVWDDPSEEQLSYEITDKNGDVVNEGRLVVNEYNINTYDDYKYDFIVDETKHPKYLLVHSDTMKRSYTGFRVPKDFNPGEIHFINKCPVQSFYQLSLDRFGDTITDIFSFRYQGKTYECEDYGDNGSVGDYKYTLLEWDENKNRYELLYEI